MRPLPFSTQNQQRELDSCANVLHVNIQRNRMSDDTRSKSQTVPKGARLTYELAEWIRLSIADAVVVFGHLEQEIIEIAWLIKGADIVKERVRLSRNPAGENFSDIVGLVEEAAGQEFDGLRGRFSNLSYDRNLIVHGAWLMVDDRPYVVWHKFLEDTDSVMGEYYDRDRFKDFMLKANALLEMCRKFHTELEKSSEVNTSALRRVE
jgi:hypothetical protein